MRRSDQIKARKVLEAEKARTLFDFEADRRQVKVRASGMGDENIPTKSTEERAEYRKKAPWINIIFVEIIQHFFSSLLLFFSTSFNWECMIISCPKKSFVIKQANFFERAVLFEKNNGSTIKLIVGIFLITSFDHITWYHCGCNKQTETLPKIQCSPQEHYSILRIQILTIGIKF